MKFFRLITGWLDLTWSTDWKPLDFSYNFNRWWKP